MDRISAYKAIKAQNANSGDTEVAFWVGLPGDGRHEASAVASVRVPQRDALRLAKGIEQMPDQFPFDTRAELAKYGFSLPEGCSVRPGHGTTIAYPSGRRRTVRNWGW